MRVARAFLPLAVLAFAGCESIFGEEVCHTAAYDAVHVLVTDARSGEPLASGSNAFVRRGEYVEPMIQPPDSLADDFMRSLMIARGNGPGEYEIVVSRTGYRGWSGTADVGFDGCSVVTEDVAVQLQPVT